MLGLLHQQRRGHDGVDPRPGQDRGHAVQVRLGHRHQPVAASGRRGSCSTAAAPPAARSASCAASTRSRASSSRAARPAARPRWSSSTSTTPTSTSSSGARSKEEKKAWTLIDAGYDGSFDGEAYKSVFFQNSNNSVRVTDEFMEAVQKDRDWRAALAARRQPGRDVQGARPVARHRRRRRGSAATPACSTTRRSTPGTRRRARRASTPRTRAASTCTSTTRPATWRR